jgi:hypothetical protein
LSSPSPAGSKTLFGFDQLDVKHFASILQQSEHSPLDLACNLADIQAARDQIAVTLSLVTKRTKLVDNLIFKYQEKLSSMESSGSQTLTSSSQPAFIEGSSKDGNIVDEVPDSCDESEDVDQLVDDDED